MPNLYLAIPKYRHENIAITKIVEVSLEATQFCQLLMCYHQLQYETRTTIHLHSYSSSFGSRFREEWEKGVNPPASRGVRALARPQSQPLKDSLLIQKP